MKIFLYKDPETECEFISYGRSAKEIAKKMNISTYMFKKNGWKQVTGEKEKDLLMRFIVVSKTIKGYPSIIGPFTEEEYLKRKTFSLEDEHKQSIDFRHKNSEFIIGKASKNGALGKEGIEIKFTTNGAQWNIFVLTQGEAESLAQELINFLEKHTN